MSECETRPRACAAEDRAADVAVDDSTGEAFVYGLTASTNFPAEAPLQAASGGGQDAFVAVLNAAGNDFVYSTYLGGSGTDTATRIDLNSSGAAYVSGTTRSATGTAAAPSVTNNFPRRRAPSGPRPASPADYCGDILDSQITAVAPQGSGSQRISVLRPAARLPGQSRGDLPGQDRDRAGAGVACG